MTLVSHFYNKADEAIWGAAKTCILAGVTAILAVYGQVSLSNARPIFPLIAQNYVLWQTGYWTVLVIACIMILAAFARQISAYQAFRKKAERQAELDRLKARREERDQAQRLARARARELPFSTLKRARKFDY